MRRGLALALLLVPGLNDAATYALPPPGASLVGEIAYETTAHEDTLIDVARRRRVGYEELVMANPSVDRWLPGEGTQVIVPTRYILPSGPRKGIVVNLAEYRLYYYPKTKRGSAPVVETYAVSAGRDDWQTPQHAVTFIRQRLRNPAWYPPKSIRREHAAAGDPLPAVVPPGPDNPLGPLALQLAIPGGYFIHGTSKAFGIGMSVTHGCLRLYPEDMAALFERVPVNTPVRIVNEPYKAALEDGVLYLEAHPGGEPGEPRPNDEDLVRASFERALTGRGDYAVEWADIEATVLQPRGVPVPVPRRAAAPG
ncbi:MAG TPA: L,D-transpeptidase family protein [Verrucomicrobiae bacterium]|nr:L,D-transpeptidase family protein [Verrucomicrobiae bacterium]